MIRIEQRIEILAPIQRCFDLARSIEVHLRGTEKSGEEAVGGVTSSLMGAGEWVRWRAKHLGVRQYLTSKITALDSPTYFQDSMIEGAFRSMTHDHYFASLSENATEMTDHFVFAAPIPILGLAAERLFLRSYMDRFLRHRNLILKEVAESSRWREFLPDARESKTSTSADRQHG